MHRTAGVVVLLALGCAATPRLTPRSGAVFVEPEGIELTLLDVDGEAGPQTLVRVRGTLSRINDVVLAHRLHDSGDALFYVTTLRGGDYYTVRVDDFPRRGSCLLQLPERPSDGVRLRHDPERSAALDAEALVAEHRRQLRDGTLARLQEFDRPAEIAAITAELNDDTAALAAACARQLPLAVVWESFSDAELRGRGLVRACAAPHDQLRRLCEHEAGKQVVARLSEVRCRRAPAMSLELDGQALAWQLGDQDVNRDDFLRRRLREEIAWPELGNLQARLDVERTLLCTDDKGHYAGLAPHREAGEQVIFGDGRGLVRLEPLRFLGGNWFFEPREFNASHNEALRGYDLRYHSYVEADRQKGTCKVSCGERVSALRLLDVAETAARLSELGFVPGPERRRPYALARDRAGTYYFVDTGNEPDSRRFRLFSGPKGNLKELKMVNITSDSRGDVFATENGSLRLILEQEESFWVKESKNEKLVNVPLHDNWRVVYHELGVYTGVPFGTPCDIW